MALSVFLSSLQGTPLDRREDKTGKTERQTRPWRKEEISIYNSKP
jgi:hypothetical protein